MMGERQVQQEVLFPSFSSNGTRLSSILLRSIDRFIDLDGLRQELAPL
jgi:hypothetical protein